MHLPELEQSLTSCPPTESIIPENIEPYFYPQSPGSQEGPEIISLEKVPAPQPGTTVGIIDLGSSNVKAIIVNENGILGAAKMSVVDLLPSSSWGQISNPYELSRRVILALKKASQDAQEPPLDALGFVGIMHGLSLFNDQGDALASFTYTNTQAQPVADEWRQNHPEWSPERGIPFSSMYLPEIAACLQRETQTNWQVQKVASPVEAVIASLTQGLPNTTSQTLSHLGLWNLSRGHPHEAILSELGLTADNLLDLATGLQVGSLSLEACKAFHFPDAWQNIPLYELNGDGLAIHFATDLLKLAGGSLKIESTGVVRRSLATLPQSLPEGAWIYLHETASHKTPMVGGAATSSGTKTLEYYLVSLFEEWQQNPGSLLAQETTGQPSRHPTWSEFLNVVGQQLDAYLNESGIPSRTELPACLLPFHLGERAPGYRGQRPHGFRGEPVTNPLQQAFLAYEGVCLNVWQALELIKSLGDLPPEFLATGALYLSHAWLNLFCLYLNVNITLLEHPRQEQTAVAAGVRLLEELGVPQSKLKRLLIAGETVTPEKVLQDNPQVKPEHIEGRKALYLEHYTESS